MSLKKLASLIVKISANGAQAQAEFRKLEKSAQEFGQSMQRVGKNMSKYVTIPLTAMAALSINAANTQLQAEARLLTALKGREDVQKRLIKQAAELQSRSLYGDEAIIEQQAYLAALGMSEQQINDTIEAAAQLAAALGMDLNSAVRNLAKTYSGMTGELGESVPALRELTAEELKAGAAIEYVKENYQGFAETAAETGTGPLVQLKNKLGDLAEKVGTILIPILDKVVVILDALVDALSKLPEGAQTAVVGFGVIAAAIGPVLMAVGSIISSLKLIIPAVASVKTAMVSAFGAGGPIFVAVTALVGMLVELYNMTNRLDQWSKEWEDKEKQRLADKERLTREGALKSYYGYTQQEDAYNSRGELVMRAGKVEGNYDVERIRRRIAELQNLASATDKFLHLQENLTREELNLIHKTWPNQPFENAKALLPDINAELRGLRQALSDIEAGRTLDDILNSVVVEEFNATTEETVGIIGKLQEQIEALEDKKLLATSKEEIGEINLQLAELNKQLDEIKDYDPTKVVTKLDTIATKPLTFGVSGPKMASLEKSFNFEEWKKKFITMSDEMVGLVNSLNSALSNAFGSLASAMGEGIEAAITGDEFKPMQRLMLIIGDMLKQMGAALVAYATALEAFKEAWKNPWIAFGAGLAAIAAGSVITGLAKRGLPKLAQGGLAYGPTIAVVGDNPGAANDPEVVAPLSKLRDYMGGQKLELTGDIQWEMRGDTLRAVLDRNNIRVATLG